MFEGSERTTIQIDELLKRSGQPDAEKLAKKESVAVAQLLEKLGYGVEPDARFGGPVLAASAPGVIFRLPPHSPSAPSQAYTTAATLLHLAAVVAVADGNVSDTDQRHLEAHLEAALELEDGEGARLTAHLDWLLEARPKLTGIKRRLGGLTEGNREAIGQSLVTVAAADGHISPEEISTLSKIYELLGLDAGSMYSLVHSLSSQPPAATEPVIIRPGEPEAGRYKIRPANAQLDRASIDRKLAETAVVSSLLSTIFEDDEPGAGPTEPGLLADASGLDSRHGELLRALSERPSWERPAVEGLAGSLGLMTDGALELLNEAAFSSCDAPLWEGEDPLEIDTMVAKEMLT